MSEGRGSMEGKGRKVIKKDSTHFSTDAERGCLFIRDVLRLGNGDFGVHEEL